MKIEVSTDTRADDRQSVMASIANEVENGLKHFRTRLTRVDVHLRDVNGPRSGADHRCALEVRPAGLDPVAVTHEAPTTLESVKGALAKMKQSLGTVYGRQQSRQVRAPASELPD